MTRRRWKIGAAVLVAGMAAVYLGNTSRLADPIGTRPFLVAHRGMAQGFDRVGLTGRTCTAARMLPSPHGYLENTLPSMRAAFEHGADMVEIDVQRTADGRFAVFHDWTLECRTEGSGSAREYTLAELQRLDVGHGYTADGGRTWPFRGKGVGMMPSLEEVLTAFPDGRFVLDMKTNDPEDGELLAERLAGWNVNRGGEIFVTGGARAVDAVRGRLSHVRAITRPQLKRCLIRYLALGWSGHVPADCRGSLLAVPANVAPWLWGWPNRFLRRMEDAGTTVTLIGDYGGEKFSTGFDDPSRLDDLPDGYAGGIWTDRIDLLGPAVRDRWGSPAP